MPMPMKPAVLSLKRVVQCNMDDIYYQYHMLAKLENFNEVRFNALDHLLAKKKRGLKEHSTSMLYQRTSL
jgi:hypothetical protein